jgi:8-oxo-dGTP diphosphatase
LGIDIAAPRGPPVQEVRADTFDMQSWLIEAWAGSPADAAPDEHDAIPWFTEDTLGELCLAHDSYLGMFSKVFAANRADLDRARALIGAATGRSRSTRTAIAPPIAAAMI